MKKERACATCGCTENRACMGPAGPCAWDPVRPDICTACSGHDAAHRAQTHERVLLECLALGPEPVRDLRARTVTKLQRSGLVEIRMDPGADGRRAAHAHITRAGRARMGGAVA